MANTRTSAISFTTINRGVFHEAFIKLILYRIEIQFQMKLLILCQSLVDTRIFNMLNANNYHEAIACACCHGGFLSHYMTLPIPSKQLQAVCVPCSFCSHCFCRSDHEAQNDTGSSKPFSFLEILGGASFGRSCAIATGTGFCATVVPLLVLLLAVCVIDWTPSSRFFPLFSSLLSNSIDVVHEHAVAPSNFCCECYCLDTYAIAGMILAGVVKREGMTVFARCPHFSSTPLSNSQ